MVCSDVYSRYMDSARDKQCVACGAWFKRSRADSTVHCPACRKSVAETVISSATKINSRYDIGRADANNGRDRQRTMFADYHRGYDSVAR
jgi:protein-arginine kinase activator protein McsA